MKKNKFIEISLIGLFILIFCTILSFNNLVYAAIDDTLEVSPKTEEFEGDKIEDGVYFIKSALSENKVISIEDGKYNNFANAHIWDNLNKEYQKFELKYDENLKAYTITAVHSNKSLDVSYAGQENGTNVAQYDTHKDTSEQWILQETEDGYYYIISKCNYLYLDIQAGQIDNGTNIQMYEGNGTKAQKFKFEKTEKIINSKIEEGTYYIESAIAENKVISIEDGKYNNFANAHIWDNLQKKYQKFQLAYDTNLETYTITALHSDKSLDVSYAGQENGTNVAQYDTHKDTSEQWMLQEAGDGYYYIISKCNYLCLDVNAGQSDNGTNIQMYEKNETKAQKFKFIKTTDDVTTKTIEEGIYNIITKVDNNKVFDIENKNDKIKVTDKSNIINKRQVYELKYLSNGYYTIKTQRYGGNLEVENGSHDNCANIVQNLANDKLTTQQWIIKETEDGYYNIVSRCNGLYIDIPGGNANNNQLINMYEGNGTDAQKFKFEKANQKIEGQRLLEDGVYKINTALSSIKYIDISAGSYNDGANAQIWDKDNVQQQKFQIKYNENEKYYEIKSVNSGKVLDVQSNGKTDGTNVWQYESNGSDAQKWILQEAGNGYYYIIALNSYLYLDVNAGSTNNGTNIQIYEGNGTNAQKFRFEKTKMIEPDEYNIELKQDRTKVLDIDAGSTNEGANVQIWKFDGVNQQIFKIEYIDDTYCKIIAKHSNQVLTVRNNNVVQETYKDIDAQKWSFEVVGKGYYKIKSKENGLYLDVDGNNTANGTNIQVYEGNSSNAQIFKTRKSITFEKGTYGESGLLKAGDSRGSQLEYYRYGDGPNVFFATFAIHGFEDNWAHDGEALVNIANKFYDELKNNHIEDYELSEKWTIYILPELNPDGRRYGYTNNGPGRTTLYSQAPNNKGIDMNRSWKSSGFNAKEKNRNYAGTAPYQAYEAQAVRDFLISHKSQNGQTVLVDLHGWLQQLIGNSEVASYYGVQFPGSNTKSLERYGDGYLIGWARTALASNGRLAKTALIELPRDVYSMRDVENQDLANRYIRATLDMLYGVN